MLGQQFMSFDWSEGKWWWAPLRGIKIFNFPGAHSQSCTLYSRASVPKVRFPTLHNNGHIRTQGVGLESSLRLQLRFSFIVRS